MSEQVTNNVFPGVSDQLRVVMEALRFWHSNYSHSIQNAIDWTHPQMPNKLSSLEALYLLPSLIEAVERMERQPISTAPQDNTITQEAARVLFEANIAQVGYSHARMGVRPATWEELGGEGKRVWVNNVSALLERFEVRRKP